MLDSNKPARKPDSKAKDFIPDRTSPEAINPPHGITIAAVRDLIDQLHRWFLPCQDFCTIALTNVPQGIFTERGEMLGAYFYNPTQAVVYIKLFDRHDSPALGFTEPAETIPLPAASMFPLSPFSRGIYFHDGMWIAATANINASDNTAPGAALTAIVYFKAL